MSKLIKIEPSQCKHLNIDDNCFYFMEYHPRQGYQHGYTNSLIFNFKKSIHDKGQPYKVQAINEVAELVSSFFKRKTLENRNDYIFIPIPTSKSKTDPDYDNRLVSVLEIVKNETGVGYCDVLDRITSIQPLHTSNKSRDATFMHEFRFTCADTTQFHNKTLILFDDIITSGSTYGAAKRLVASSVLHCKIVGLFIAKSRV